MLVISFEEFITTDFVSSSLLHIIKHTIINRYQTITQNNHPLPFDYIIRGSGGQQKKGSVIMDEMRTSSEKLLELVRGMSEQEVENILYLIQGVKVGESAAAAKSA